MHGSIHIGHLADDQRVVATHFQRQDFLRLAGKVLVQQVASGGATGKEQAVDAVVSGQRHTCIACALRQVDHACRQAGFIPQAHGFLRGPRRELGRFEDHGITGNQRRHDMAVGQVAREVVWAEHRHHAMRLVTQHRLRVAHRRTTLTGTLLVGLHRDVHLVHHGGDFGLRFPQRLAGFLGNDLGQRGLVGGQQLAKTAGNGDTLVQRAACPGLERGARGGHGGIHLLAAGGIALPDLLAGSRVALTHGFAAAGQPQAIDELGTHCAVSFGDSATTRSMSPCLIFSAAACSAVMSMLSRPTCCAAMITRKPSRLVLDSSW